MIDFEVLDISRRHPSFWDSLARFFNSRRKQLQDWDASPPVLFGIVVLLLVSAELSTVMLLLSGEPLASGFGSKMSMLAFVILVMELLFVGVAKELGGYFNKRGHTMSAWTFLNIGLIPLLLLLPITVCMTLSGGVGLGFTILLILVCFQVLANWKESVEVAFELSRLQSAVVVYLTGGVVVSLALLGAYLTLIKTVSGVMSFL